jgi:hypothetical protein
VLENSNNRYTTSRAISAPIATRLLDHLFFKMIKAWVLMC